MILTVFKCLHFGKYPGDPKEMFRLSSCTYSLRSNDIYRTAVEFDHFRKLIMSYNSILQIVNLGILLIYFVFLFSYYFAQRH